MLWGPVVGTFVGGCVSAGTGFRVRACGCAVIGCVCLAGGVVGIVGLVGCGCGASRCRVAGILLCGLSGFASVRSVSVVFGSCFSEGSECGAPDEGSGVSTLSLFLGVDAGGERKRSDVLAFFSAAMFAVLGGVCLGFVRWGICLVVRCWVDVGVSGGIVSGNANT